MIHRCRNIENCKVCIFISRAFGHPLMFLLRKKWKKITIGEVINHMRGLKLEIVGGLVNKGWTIHDIDVIGNAKDIPIFVERLEKAGVKNPVHLCDKGLHEHSHFLCLMDGLKLILFENKAYKTSSPE